MAASELLSAVALDLKTVRVLFGFGGSPDDSADLTTPLSAVWTVLATTAPAYEPSVASVTGYTEGGSGWAGVTLIFEQELTPGVVYALKVTGVTGISENDVDNLEPFQAKTLDFPAERDFSLWNYVPAINKKEDTEGELEAFISCVQEPLNLLVNDVDHWIDILDCDLAPENFVDLMLRDLGNPFEFSNTLTLTEKRRLAASLVELYKLKGTTLGVQTAIRFFMGMRSEILRLDGLGNHINAAAAPGPPPPKYTGKLSSFSTGGLASPSFKLGSRKTWRFLVRAGTTVRSQTDAGHLLPQAGGTLTDRQEDQIQKILAIMKPAYMIQVATGLSKRTGTEPSRRNGIKLNDDATVTLIMQHIPDSDDRVFFQGGSPGVNEFSSTTTLTTTDSGDLSVVDSLVVSGDQYWNGVGRNFSAGTNGLLSNEITNALFEPTLTVTPGVGKNTLNWNVATSATSWRIYRSSSAALVTTDADNAATPIELSGDLSEYVDVIESGSTKFYIIAPVVEDSEGFMSDEISGTAL